MTSRIWETLYFYFNKIIISLGERDQGVGEQIILVQTCDVWEVADEWMGTDRVK